VWRVLRAQAGFAWAGDFREPQIRAALPIWALAVKKSNTIAVARNSLQVCLAEYEENCCFSIKQGP
jgi:hypothetical protein